MKRMFIIFFAIILAACSVKVNEVEQYFDQYASHIDLGNVFSVNTIDTGEDVVYCGYASGRYSKNFLEVYNAISYAPPSAYKLQYFKYAFVKKKELNIMGMTFLPVEINQKISGDDRAQYDMSAIELCLSQARRPY